MCRHIHIHRCHTQTLYAYTLTKVCVSCMGTLTEMTQTYMCMNMYNISSFSLSCDSGNLTVWGVLEKEWEQLEHMKEAVCITEPKSSSCACSHSKRPYVSHLEKKQNPKQLKNSGVGVGGTGSLLGYLRPRISLFS